jgi:hypothetical protein
LIVVHVDRQVLDCDCLSVVELFPQSHYFDHLVLSLQTMQIFVNFLNPFSISWICHFDPFLLFLLFDSVGS